MLKLNVTKVAHLTGHRDAIYAMERSPAGDEIYTAGADGYIVKWKPQQSTDGALVVRSGQPVYSLFVHPSGKSLFCGTSKGNLHFIDLESNTEQKNIEAHTEGIFDIKQSGSRLFTASGNGTIKIWSLPGLELLQVIRLSDKSIRTLAFSGDGLLAAGSSDHKIYLLDPENAKTVNVLHGHSNSVFALAFGRDKRLLSGGRDAMLKTWDPDTALIIEDIPAHLMQIKSIAFNSSFTLFATTSMDKTIKIWDAASHKLLKVIDKARNDSHTNCINKITWLSETEFVTAGDDRAVIAWKIDTL